MPVAIQNAVYAHLRSAADSANIKINGAVTPVAFEFAPDAGDTVLVRRIIIKLQDGGAFDAEKFGNAIVLANGMLLQVVNADDEVLLDLLDGMVLQTNGDIARECFDVNVHSWGTGDEILVARWTFSKDVGDNGVLLSGDLGHKLRLTVRDDQTGLVDGSVAVRGVKIND